MRGEGDEPREATFGDVAILLPKRTGLDRLGDALEARGIPFRADVPGGFFGQAEVRDLVHVLRAVDDPQDRLSTFAALRSRAFACSDEDLVLHAAADGSLSHRAPRAEGAPAAVTDALGVLGELHRERRGLSVAELVRRAATDLTGIGFMPPDTLIDSWVHRVKYAYPVYDLGFARHIGLLLDHLDRAGIVHRPARRPG